MAATQIVSSSTSTFVNIDNGSAPVFPTLNAGASLGYDTIPGLNPQPAATQGQNPLGNGSVLIDTGNDYASGTSRVPQTGTSLYTNAAVITVLNTPNQQRLLFKSPA